MTQGGIFDFKAACGRLESLNLYLNMCTDSRNNVILILLCVLIYKSLKSLNHYYFYNIILMKILSSDASLRHV